MMEDLIAVSTSYSRSNNKVEDTLAEAKGATGPSATSRAPATNPSEALEILRHEPDYDTLIRTLKFLKNEDNSVTDFKITSPSPITAQLVQGLVSDILPNYWTILQESQDAKTGKSKKPYRAKGSSDIALLLSCLRSVPGLSAIVFRLRSAIQEAKESNKNIGTSSAIEIVSILSDVLARTLEGDNTLQIIWDTISEASDSQAKQRTLWQELLALVAGGRILGVAAESGNLLDNLKKDKPHSRWTGDGVHYSKWLAHNIASWAKELPINDVAWTKCGELITRSLRLGYTESILKEILTRLVLTKEEQGIQFTRLLNELPALEQKNILQAFLKLISKEYLGAAIVTEDNDEWWHEDAGTISAIAGLIKIIIADNGTRKEALVNWLTASTGAGVGENIGIRRAAVAVVSGDRDDLMTVLEKSLEQFGDQLYIGHTPTLQQEVHAQVLLLSAGYVHRVSPLKLSMLMRTGKHLSVISNRLSASSPRARFLGMVVGEALSSLVDKGDKVLQFKVEDVDTAEAKWYKRLVAVSDKVGSVNGLKSNTLVVPEKKSASSVPKATKAAHKSKTPPAASKIVSIEEVETDDESSDEEGLTPYRKPDSDAEDSDEDPTLITRNKPTAPVYIRDLITYLRDSENYDRQKLALMTAASLINRKANFGTEVTSHIEELATLLVGLQDKYDIDDFQEMRLQSMIAVLKAQPLKMGQWYSKTFFDGDYSIAQRASILTALGLGARELGGLGAEDARLTSSSRPSQGSSFPSKTLPEAMHNIYASEEDNVISKLSTQLSKTMIAPLAAEAADMATGPQVLNVRTFSSRMEVESKRKKPIANSLAKIVANGFFFPLTGRFFVHLKAYGSSRHSNVVFQPFLLTLFIKTLSLLLHASGPSTLSLPQMTAEFWDLLLNLRVQAVGDITITEAVLFSFLTILEVNEDKRQLVEAHGKQLTETQEWVQLIFERMGAGGSEEDEKVRVLAAACLVRIKEVVEKYQALLIGDIPMF